MRLKKYTRKPSLIECVWEEKNSQGEYEERSQKFKEAPLPVLNTAVQDLKTPIETIFEVTPKWMKTVTQVLSFTVHYTDEGLRSMEVKFTKAFANKTTRDFTTTQFRLDPPEGTTDKTERAVSLEEAALCFIAIEAVEAYIGGDRQQMTLAGIENSTVGADSEEGNELGLEDAAPREESNKDDSIQPKKPTRAKRKKKSETTK